MRSLLPEVGISAQAGISNCAQYSVGCNYLSLSEIPASGNRVLIYGIPDICQAEKNSSTNTADTQALCITIISHGIDYVR